jgi:hypothetical protein
MISIDGGDAVEDVEAQQAEEVPAQLPMHTEMHTSKLQEAGELLFVFTEVVVTLLAVFALCIGKTALGIFCFAVAAGIAWVGCISLHLRTRETVDAPSHRMCDEFPIIDKNSISADLPDISADDMCCICLEPKTEGDRLRQMPICLHDFHVACFDSWCSTQSAKSSGLKCPLCRQAHPVTGADTPVYESEHSGLRIEVV